MITTVAMVVAGYGGYAGWDWWIAAAVGMTIAIFIGLNRISAVASQTGGPATVYANPGLLINVLALSAIGGAAMFTLAHFIGSLFR